MTAPAASLFYDVVAEVLGAAVDALNEALPPEHRHQHQNTVERAAARRRGAVRAQILARELILVSH